MRRIQKIIGLFVGVFSLAVSIHLLRAAGQAGATASSAASRSQKTLAVAIVRYINTVEVIDCRSQNGQIDENEKFLPWDELREAPCFKEAQSRMPLPVVDELSQSLGPEIVPGLELRLVVSADGRHYNLWLGQKSADVCGFAFFSDERGVIYEGKPIGCEVREAPAKP
jgi:hypothetical protein